MNTNTVYIVTRYW